MPKPKKDETQSEFIKRCVNFIVNSEGKDPKHAVAICYGIWKAHKKDDKDV